MSLQQRDKTSQTPLHIAVLEMRAWILPSVTRENELRWTLSPGQRNVTQLKSFQRYVATQVHEAARNGDIACLKELLGAGAEPRLGRRGS
jgi:ankyrin repeat protein